VVAAEAAHVLAVVNLPRMQQVADARLFDFLALPMTLQQQPVAAAADTAVLADQLVVRME
jgi:hypothetical protein